jgi:TIR domain
MTDPPADFFVSYTGSDEAWAIWVARRLELAGYRVVLQAWDFGAGNFLVKMEEAIQAEWLLPILSRPYLGSRWGRQEWATYMDTDESRVIPIQIEDIDRRSMLRPLQRIKLIGLDEHDAGEKLLRDIARLTRAARHDPRDRQNGQKSGFPGIAYSISADAVRAPDRDEPPGPTVPVDRHRIQVILLGDGEAAGEAVRSFCHLLGVGPERCCNLFGSGLSADEQVATLAGVMQDLNPEAVSDVLVIFAGTGSNPADAGVRLDVRATDPAHPATTSLDLALLLERLQDDQHRMRSYVILDAVGADGQQVGPTAPAAVAVLKLGRGDRGGRGLAAILAALARPVAELAGKLPHWGPLSLEDLRVLAEGVLVAHEGSAAYQIGLVPSPLAWPREDRADGRLANWCAVVSDSDRRMRDRESEDPVDLVIDQLAVQSLTMINHAYRRRGHPIELAPSPGKLMARNVLASPGSFAHAVEQVCAAELAVFDLTNFEPAVMILLGIRAVIRRGLTVCVARQHDPPWRDAEPPFHLREVSLVMSPTRDAVQARILEGIKQLAQPGNSYSDLPCFDLIRNVSPDPEQRQTRAFDAERNPSILALVPFDPDYVRRNWKHIKSNLPATAQDKMIKLGRGADEVARPALLRTLDLDSPRVVSAQLFEAIRLTDFCLVDVTTVRPNVFFELGVRLAANRLHPVVIVDPGYPAPPGEAETMWFQGVRDQLTMFQRLLQPVPYAPTDLPAFTYMVDRHLEFRRRLRQPDDPRPDSLLGGLPLAGVYDIAWRHAAERDEVVTVPVEEHLQSGGEALLVDRSLGQRHLIYPTTHRLTQAAERTGLEYLVAAWLYLHFRVRAGDCADEAAAKRYQALTDTLMLLLDQTGVESDASFVDSIDQWLAGDDGPAGPRIGGDHG